MRLQMNRQIKNKIVLLSYTFMLSVSVSVQANIKVTKTSADLSKASFDESTWKGIKEDAVSLMGQPMIPPRPKTTTTSQLSVQAVQDGKWIAFRLRWKSDHKSEAGKLGEFSDAVALQFPVKEGNPPPIFMGSKESPVHIFHWRAQYQRDIEKGKPTMKELYPNMNPDMYPMEFADSGSVKGLDDQKREIYSPGKAEGNTQSYQKSGAVDEIFAEGFGSSSVVQNRSAVGLGKWQNGEWIVVIARPLKLENGSVLDSSKNGHVAFAVWQGAKQEVGSRKSITMSWVPLQLTGGSP